MATARDNSAEHWADDELLYFRENESLLTVYKRNLMNMFTNFSVENIERIVAMVYLNASQHSSEDELLGIMACMLSESGESALQTPSCEDEDDPERSVTELDIAELIDVFNDICPIYLREFCEGFGSRFTIKSAAEKLVNENYVKLNKDPQTIFEHLQVMLPDVDPTYLQERAYTFAERSINELSEFVMTITQGETVYPTKKEYYTNKRKLSELNWYKDQFDIEKFVKRIPNPEQYFTTFDNEVFWSRNTETVEKDRKFVSIFFYNFFPRLRQRDIDLIFLMSGYNLLKTFEHLKKLPMAFVQARPAVVHSIQSNNEGLHQMLAYMKYERQIKHYIKMKTKLYSNMIKQAEAWNVLQCCQCCFDDRLLPEECYCCTGSCVFCKDCIRKGAEVAIVNGSTLIKCFNNCGAEISPVILRILLDSTFYERFMEKRQLIEIKQANIEGLESCPLCQFSMIPIEGSKTFQCKNVECLLESCRICWHKSHLPKKCNEIEYEEDVRMRTFIEEKMTEAFSIHCVNCNRAFYITTGCNKVICPCGTMMCYNCRQVIDGYGHFERQICPLFNDNLDDFHKIRVQKAGDAAKREIGADVNPSILKFDPTVEGINSN